MSAEKLFISSAGGNGAGLTLSASGLAEVHGVRAERKAGSGDRGVRGAAPEAAARRELRLRTPSTVIFPKRMAPSAVMAGAIRKLPSQRIRTALFHGSVATRRARNVVVGGGCRALRTVEVDSRTRDLTLNLRSRYPARRAAERVHVDPGLRDRAGGDRRAARSCCVTASMEGACVARTPGELGHDERAGCA